MADPALPPTLPPAACPAVLLVDDDADLRLYLSRRLSGRFMLTAVSTAREALDAVTASTPDLILLDVGLPDASGLELFRHLRAQPAFADVPIVVMTGMQLARPQDADRSGRTAYVLKPFTARVLLTCIDRLLCLD